MVLDRPNGVEARLIGDARDADLFVEDVAVRTRSAGGYRLTLLLRLIPVPIAIILIDWCFAISLAADGLKPQWRPARLFGHELGR